MKYLRKFNNHTEYETNRDNLIRPNVSYCVQENEVHYNPIPHDYSQDYLTFEALEDGTFSFKSGWYMPNEEDKVKYSLDNGSTWTTLEFETPTPIVTAGSKILWKGNIGPNYYQNKGIGTFSSTGQFNVEGNAMSLFFGDDFIGKTSLANALTKGFYQLFYNCSNLISAENLSLPATILNNYCYESMFQDCTSLTTAPSILPSLLDGYNIGRCLGCYMNMFNGCTSLTTAPSLPATTLERYCYQYMFGGCTSLNYIKCLATNISASNCTQNWVSGVASNGTFVKNASMTSWTTGESGIPSGWTVEDA